MVPDYNDKRSAYGPRRFGTITIDNIGIELLVKIMSVHPTGLWRTKNRNLGVSYIKDSYGVRNQFKVAFGTPEGLSTYEL